MRRCAAVREIIVIAEFDRMARQANVSEKRLPREPRHAFPRLAKTGPRRRREGDARVRRPPAVGAHRSRPRQKVARIDRHLHARPLRGNGRAQPNNAAPDDGHGVGQNRSGFFNRDVGRAPGQRPTAAAVAIVVNDELVADGLGVQPRSHGPEGPQAAPDVDDPLRTQAVRRQRRLRRGRRTLPRRHCAGAQPGKATECKRMSDKFSAVHIFALEAPDKTRAALRRL